MKIPLSWLQLTHEKIRFLIALAGISFADILMFMQLGFQDALFESNITLHKSFKGDIFFISPQSESVINLKSFSRRRLYESIGVEGIKSVNSVYLDFAFWKNPIERNSRGILVVGFNPEDNVLNLPGVQNNLAQIKLQDVVLFDVQSREEFGPIPQLFNEGKQVTAEAASRRVKIGGLFSLGASFAADGNIVTSDLNFLRIFPNRNSGLIDLGIINLNPQANLESILATLRQKLPNDIKVFSKEEFIEFEKTYWQNGTAIGFIFTLGTGMGFIVGTVIVYQILYTDVANHLPEYATLKAMGYSDSSLLIVVFQEAVILACIGYIPGFLLANVLYLATANATALPIMMTISRAIMVLTLTLIMCLFSGNNCYS